MGLWTLLNSFCISVLWCRIEGTDVPLNKSFSQGGLRRITITYYQNREILQKIKCPR